MAKHYHIETPLKLDGKRLPVGQTVPLDDARAEELLAMGAITPAATPAPKPAARTGAKPSSPAGK